MEEVKKIKIDELIIDEEFKNSIPPLSLEALSISSPSINSLAFSFVMAVNSIAGLKLGIFAQRRENYNSP